MKKQVAAMALTGLLAGLTTGQAQAQFAKVEDAIKYRQSVMAVQGNHMGRLAAMAKGTRPFDATQAQQSARIVDTMMKLGSEGFVPNSAVAPSKIKGGDPWANAADFKAKNDKALEETGKLVAASASLDTLKQQLGNTGGACKSCHDEYRKD